MRRWKWVMIFAATTLISYLVWQEFRMPSNFESKNNNDENIAIISFYTAIAGALAGLFSLLKEIIALFREGKKDGS